MNYALVRDDDETVILPELEIADRFWTRLIGLQFRRQLPVQRGLWISPCSSIHTCFMRFPIDVLMLDGDGHVLQTRRSVWPWRVVWCPRGTRVVVETKVAATDVCAGTRLKILRVDDAGLPDAR